MIATLEAILNFLFLTSWLFWAEVGIIPLVCYFLIDGAVKDDEFPTLPLFLIAAVGFGVAWKYPSVWQFFTTWTNWLIAFGGYIVAGFIVATVKWLIVLNDFRNGNITETIASAKKSRDRDIGAYVESGGKGNPELFVKSLKEYLSYTETKNLIVSEENGKIKAYPNWKKYPIGSWWNYWPFFALSTVFSRINKLIEFIYTLFRHYWESLAAKFSVTG